MSDDWDAQSHIEFLRRAGGPSSGYTADLIEEMLEVLNIAYSMLPEADSELPSYPLYKRIRAIIRK